MNLSLGRVAQTVEWAQLLLTCLWSGDADGDRASELQHAVECVNGGVYLGSLQPYSIGLAAGTLTASARRSSVWARNASPITGVVQNPPFFGLHKAHGNSRPVRVGFRLEGCPVREAFRLSGSSSLGLKRSQAEQGQPVRMALAGHQLPWAFALALGTAAAHEAPMVQEEAQQIQV